MVSPIARRLKARKAVRSLASSSKRPAPRAGFWARRRRASAQERRWAWRRLAAVSPAWMMRPIRLRIGDRGLRNEEATAVRSECGPWPVVHRPWSVVPQKNPERRGAKAVPFPLLSPGVPPTSAAVSSRRRFLRALGLGALGVPAAGALSAQSVPEALLPPGLQPLPRTGAPGVTPGAAPAPRLPLVQPPRLRPGGLIGLVAPAGHPDPEGQVEDTQRELEALGFRSRPGRHALARHGYLAGTDQQRAEDLMAMFLDDDVDAILALRGGWGCARLLPLLDYDAIRAHPKPLV